MSYCLEKSRINCDTIRLFFAFLFLALFSVKSIPVIQFIVGNKCVFLFKEHFKLIYNAIIAY